MLIHDLADRVDEIGDMGKYLIEVSKRFDEEIPKLHALGARVPSISKYTALIAGQLNMLRASLAVAHLTVDIALVDLHGFLDRSCEKMKPDQTDVDVT